MDSKYATAVMKSKFENLDHAVMAVEMFRHRMKKNDLSQDYMEEK